MKYIFSVLLILFTCSTVAHTTLSDKQLKGMLPPATPGLLDGKTPIVVNKIAAIQLGKALFWDSNIGDNGMACASCHFHAGADRRHINQLNPGQMHQNSNTRLSFEPLLNAAGGANYTLKAEDFPLYKLENPNDIESKILFKTDDVVGSSGVFAQTFNRSNINSCTPQGDNLYNNGFGQVRQATKRNAPTIINAAFNRRNFWDGRANNEFNGVSAFGPRDPDARIWIKKGKKTVKTPFSLSNASLASQAVSPPTDMIEMSCQGRTFKDIAQKILNKSPLENQAIHPEDSVLSGLRTATGIGLQTSYQSLIRKAFNPIYWSDNIVETQATKQYTQTEANFSLFFGLAIQLYENTLIADASRLDIELKNLDSNGLPANFTSQEKMGAEVFADAHCDLCHSNATFTGAANPQTFNINADKTGSTFVDRIGLIPSNTNNIVDYTLVDLGFFNTGVVLDENDIGLGGQDPWGNPFSYSQQYLNNLGNSKIKLIDKFLVKTCDMTDRFILDFNNSELKSAPYSCKPNSLAKIPKPLVVKKESMSQDQGRLSVLTVGAFKIPSLRNVELTGPYMHNGSMKSLDEVVEFYNRGGNYHNRRHPGTLVFNQSLGPASKKALVAFLKTLTDERVRWEKAPFDHPAINVPHGHSTTANFGLALDNYLMIPAVGASGRSPEQGPLLPFENYLP